MICKTPRTLITRICLLACLLLVMGNVHAQVVATPIDTVEEKTREKKGSIFSGRPGKSMLFSLVVPGAGQIYNKSYLRVPFVWAAVGGMGYVLREQTRSYNCLRDAYKAKVDDVPHTPHSYCDTRIPNLTEQATRVYRDGANVNRQWAIVGFTLVWLANGVDAFVDAHLKEFDIDEDLSIDIGPIMDDDPYAPLRIGLYVKF